MSDFDTIRGRLFDRELYGYNERSPLSLPLVEAHAASMQADGSWADIDYANRERSSWDPSKHLDRTILLLRGGRHRDADAETQTRMMSAAGRAQAFWLQRRPESDNWWHNTIGGPSQLMRILILFGDDLDRADLDATIDILAGVEISMTGQNRAWVATINFVRGILIEDPDVVRLSLNEVLGEVRVSDGPEGIQPGWSFHQHGPQLYQGNYGAHFLETVAPYATLLTDTEFEMSKEHIDVLTRLTLEGTDWMTWGSRMDYHVVGRFISSPHRSRWESRVLVEPCEHLAEVNEDAADRLLAFRDRLEDRSDPGTDAPAGNRFFWRSDFMVHRAEDRYLSIRMSSTRTVRSEACNQEGLQNYHMGDGVTLFLRRGDEYDGIFPAWDWKRLPGVTCLSNDEPLPALSVGKDLGSDLFVGGVSDGTNGVSTMRSIRDGVSARKSWFCNDNVTVALGADISSHARHPVITSVNQCLMKSDVHISSKDGPEPFLYTDRLFGGLKWVHHDGVGYLLLRQMAVDLRKEPQWGAWKDINGNMSSDRVMRDVFSLWIDHGFGPQEARYAYAVVQNVDVEATQALSDSPPFDVVQNDADGQFIRWDNGMTQAVFWKPGEVAIGEDCVLSVNQGCVLMTRPADAGIVVSVANPNQLSDQIALVVRRSGSETPIQLTFPSGVDSGREVTHLIEAV